MRTRRSASAPHITRSFRVPTPRILPTAARRHNNFTNLSRVALGDPDDQNKGTVDVHKSWYAYVADNWLYDGELRVGPREGPAAVPGDVSEWTVLEGNHTFGARSADLPGHLPRPPAAIHLIQVTGGSGPDRIYFDGHVTVPANIQTYGGNDRAALASGVVLIAFFCWRSGCPAV
ncbi:MAG TPA: hypothetical protein VFC78_18330 [Tepidisphaeraceae bacterium]|nr:hypothetical protein [Tepidisphaeraceae bacterium]